MLPKFLSVAVCLTSLMLLPQCGRLDQIEDARAFAGVAADAGQTRQRVLGDPIRGIDPLPGTRFDAMPTAGEARFRGAAYVAAGSRDAPESSFALVGRSDVTVDFGASRNPVQGEMFDFQSLDIADGLIDVSGRLRLLDSEIGRDRPNSLAVGYGGTLTVGGTDFALSGEMEGRFRGTRTAPATGQSVVKALSAVDRDGQVLGGNNTLTGRVLLIAEN